MRFGEFSFGTLQIDGVTYDYDLVIVRGEIRKRKKKASRPFQDVFGHTPLSVEENIPWKCIRLVIGTGATGALPVMTQVERGADRRGVELIHPPAEEAIDVLRQGRKKTNAVIHVTC